MNIFVLAHEEIRTALSELLEGVLKHMPSAGSTVFTFGDCSDAHKLLPTGNYGIVIVGKIVQGALLVCDGKDAIIGLRHAGIITPNVLIANAQKCWYAESMTKACDYTINQDLLTEELASIANSGDGPFPEMEKFASIITLAMLKA